MIIQIGTEVDESRILWKHKESDEWERADIDDLIRAYENRPKGDWIPVSEMLPEKSKQVMCCNKQGRVFTSAMTHINSNGEPSFGKHYGVIAWQPLPEPYKGGDME